MTLPTLRIATVDDAATLAELARVTFADTFPHYPPSELAAHLDEFYTPNVFRSLLELPATTHRTWIAEHDGRAVGYAQAGPCKLPHPDASPEHGELRRFYVLPELKGTGLAQRMIDEVFAWLGATFRGPQWLGVYSENFRAQRFYARYGFTRCGQYEYPVGSVNDLEFILRRER